MNSTTIQKKPTLNPALRDFWRTKADVKILKGGRVSSKTWDAAGFASYLSSQYKVKFLCLRQFQNKIAESVYAVLRLRMEEFGIADQYEFLKSVIRHRGTGSEFHFYGFNRNVSEIKGFEGADICWIEEGEGLTKEQRGIIDPTLRKEGSELWIIYNPRLMTDYVETFKHDPGNGVIVRQINYDENPFLSETIKRKIARLKESDYEEYEHIYRGIPRTDDDQVIIKRSWIEAAIDAHEKLGLEAVGTKRSGFDVADSGKDLCSHIFVHGIVALWGEHWKAGEDELLRSCTRIYSKAIEFGSNVTYDSIGVGALAGSKFSDLNSERKAAQMIGAVGYTKFIAGAKVIDPDGFYIDTEDENVRNKDFFANLKAQAWWLVADRFRNTYNAVVNGEAFEYDDLISISSEMPNLSNLVTELSTPRRHFDKAGRVKVESKEDLAKRDIPSPNDADAFIMAYAPTEDNVMGALLEMAIGA